MSNDAKQSTDRELWRERNGDYYGNSIHVTKDGAIGINYGGTVLVASLATWHQALATCRSEPPAALRACADALAPPEPKAILRQRVADARSQFDYKDETTIRGRISRLCPWLSADSIERMIDAFCEEIETALSAPPRADALDAPLTCEGDCVLRRDTCRVDCTGRAAALDAAPSKTPKGEI